MSAELDPEYVEARRALLDALDHLREHRDSIIVAGAQAIYLRTGLSEYMAGIAPYTTDADLALDPSSLGDRPALGDAMVAAGFVLDSRKGPVEPGIWIRDAPSTPGGVVSVDLIVPSGLAAGGGRRGARLGLHGKQAARKIPGLEAVVVDNGEMTIAALDPTDRRRFVARVAGQASLLVAKLHKIHDRLADRNERVVDKDASDIYRLLGSVTADEIVATLNTLLADDRSAQATRVALGYCDELLRERGSPAVRMAVNNLSGNVPANTVVAVLTGYAAAIRAGVA